MSDQPGADPTVEAAWIALDQEGAERCLELLATTAAPERWIVETFAWLDLGAVDRARQAHARALEAFGDDDVEVVWSGAELDLARWRIPEARSAFEALASEGRGPEVLERLALCLDLEGEFDAADRLQAEAHRADPDAWPRPPRLATDAFEAIVREAVEELPEPFQRALERTAILLDPMPTRSVVGGDHPPDLLGLFVGTSLVDSSVEAPLELPPQIFLFQRNLERSCADHDQLREEIRVTLYHEIGHALGFDEDGVERMGLG